MPRKPTSTRLGPGTAKTLRFGTKNPQGGDTTMAGKIGGKPGEEIALTDKGTHTWAYTCLTDGRILVNHAHPKQGRGDSQAQGATGFEKIKCDLAKGGYLDRLSLSVDETKSVSSTKKGFKRQVAGRALYLADMPRPSRLPTPSPLPTRRAGRSGLLPALDARPVRHHVSGGRSVYLHDLKTQKTRKVSTDDSADYREKRLPNSQSPCHQTSNRVTMTPRAFYAPCRCWSESYFSQHPKPVLWSGAPQTGTFTDTLKFSNGTSMKFKARVPMSLPKKRHSA